MIMINQSIKYVAYSLCKRSKMTDTFLEMWVFELILIEYQNVL